MKQKFLMQMMQLDSLYSDAVFMMNEQLLFHGLTFHDFRILHLLGTHPDGIRRDRFAKQLNLSLSNLMRLVRPLHELQLIAINTHSDDIRRYTLALTDVGSRHLLEAEQTVEQTLQDMVHHEANRGIKLLLGSVS